MNVTSEFAEFVSRTRYIDLPQDVINRAKKLVLDTLGSIIFSSKLDWSRKVVTLVKGFNSNGRSTIIPFGFKTAAPAATLANGTMAHGFELDDYHEGAMTHPGAVVIPAALAIGEQELIDGRKFLLAVVMGYEAMCRIGMAVDGNSHILKGFHPTGTGGPFGSAVASGKIIGLKKGGLIDALGIAGSFCSGLMEFSQETSEAGGMIKRLHAGKASESGLIAALLAKEGFKGPSNIIGGKYGFCNVYSDSPKINLANYKLGTKYEILEVCIKPYPCCGTLHSVIDAIAKVKDEREFDVSEIVEIEVRGSEKLVTYHGIYKIDSVMAAQFSVPFVVALTLSGDAKDPKNYNIKYAKRKNIIEVMKKIKLSKDDDLDKAFPSIPGAKVIVKLKSGKSFETEVKYPKGHPKKEMSFEEVSNKFTVLTQDIIGDKEKEKVIELVGALEKTSDISKLTKLLTSPSNR